jgi:hypothetical protein
MSVLFPSHEITSDTASVKAHCGRDKGNANIIGVNIWIRCVHFTSFVGCGDSVNIWRTASTARPVACAMVSSDKPDAASCLIAAACSSRLNLKNSLRPVATASLKNRRAKKSQEKV